MKKLLLMFVLAASFLALASQPVEAINVFEACTADSQSAVCDARDDEATGIAKGVIGTMIYIIGIVSVIMIVVGGFRYTLSGGDQSGISGAKNTILYAVIGLIVAILAFAIVNFVLDRL